MTRVVFSDIIRSDLEVFYEIGLSGDGKALLIHLTPEAFDFIVDLLKPKLPLVERYEKWFKEKFPLFGDLFIPPNRECWGFGEVLRKTESAHPGWVSWLCPLPVILEREEAERKNAFYKRNEEAGEIPEYFPLETNNEEAERIISTLDVLFLSVIFIGEEMRLLRENKDGLSQLMLIEGLQGGGGMSSCGLWLVVSKKVCEWLSKNIENIALRQEIRRVMIGCYEAMWQEPVSDFARHDFRVMIREGGLIHLSCPGDACGIDPESSVTMFKKDDGYGYKMSPHNIDCKLQLLTLLGGMAKLHDLARADGV